jgi:phenylalanyl-tRNA synthetase beta chain
MNVSYRWLRALVPDLEDAPEVVAQRLAMYGAAVDELVDVGRALADIRIGRVLASRPHPNADRLSLCTVDAGDAEPVQVVCGAPNVRPGASYPFAPVGATLPGGLAIRRARIRGEESQGMLCSARELGLGRDHEGILELHGTFRPGASFIASVGLDDVRFVLDITPNRPDLLSHWGVARELAPRGEVSLVLPPFPAAGGEAPALARPAYRRGRREAEADGIRIRIDDAAGCPRYYGVVVRGVRVGPSPEWLASRLRAIGQRPVNSVVDATNWVLHELGQPTHAFDLRRLGPQIVVRRARAGERLTTLDGVERTLSPDMLLIADAERPVALAGVMGGLDTEVTGDTRDVLIECALFDPVRTRATRRSAGLATEASQRFERGVDPDGTERALHRLLDLIATVAGGRIAAEAPVAGVGLPDAAPLTLRPARVAQILGESFTPESLVALLEPIGFRVAGRAADGRLTIAVPGHRRYDVGREEDLVEEVARRWGYDRFATEVRPFRASAVPDDALARLEDRLRTQLAGLGLLEARTAAFAPEAEGDVALLRPLSAAEGRLRRALLPGLVHRVEANFNRGVRNIRLFEIGTVFAPGGPEGRPLEETRLAAVLTGARTPPHWSGPAEPFDLWDLKGLIAEIGRALGLEPATGGPGADGGLFEAGAYWELRSGADAFGAGGRIRNDGIDAPAWAGPVFGFEVRLTTAMARAPSAAYRPLPAHPPIERDLALLLPAGTDAGAIEHALRAGAGRLLERIEIFDVYSGDRIPAGLRSVAFRLVFRAADRTLRDDEVDAVVERLLGILKDEHGVERRG